jgi:hypothetical protein
MPNGPSQDHDVSADVRALLEKFYRDVLWEVGQHAYRGGTAVGAGAVVKRVGVAWGLDVLRIPLPRLSRRQREELKDSRWAG